MNILVCGANGFIGRHLCVALKEAGHRVLRGVRIARAPGDVAIDYMRDTDPARWLPRLDGVDAEVNAVGILCEGRGQQFDAIHCDAPVALFKACEQAGVRRVLQISALGGKADGNLTPYMRTKREADAWLAASGLHWTILRPSLVTGPDGDSSRFFRAMASLPVIGLPGKGEQCVQPVFIGDLCTAAVRTLESPAWLRKVIDIGGPEVMSYRGMLQAYRDAMGLPPPLWLPVPMSLMRMSAAVVAHLPQRVFSPDTLCMLEEGSVTDPAQTALVLGASPRGTDAWFAGFPPSALRAEAVWLWTAPMLRLVLALLWIVTGLLSMCVYPVEGSLALLGHVGLEGSAARLAMYGAAMLDCLLGLATLFAPGRPLWRMQFLLVAAYTLIISIFLPQYWLHPFGPVLKNLPVLALLIVLDAGEAATTSR
jgi:uncharacterized protein YbjT (DUF2867 family)